MAHLHNVIDDDTHFIINPDTRTIYHPDETPIMLVRNDHNSERFTFEIPSVIDGHAMAQCNKVEVHFMNINVEDPNDFNPGMYTVDDMDVLEDAEDTLLFTWLIGQEATGIAGTLAFAVRFMCVNESTKVIEYSWNTLPLIGATISDGMDNSDAVAGNYYDAVDVLLQSWISEIEMERNESIDLIDAAARSTSASVKDDIAAYGQEVRRSVAEYTITEFQDDVVTDVTGSDHNKVMSQEAVTRELNNLEAEVGKQCTEVLSTANERCDDLENKYNSIRPNIPISVTAGAQKTIKIMLGNAYRIKLKDGHVFPNDATCELCLSGDVAWTDITGTPQGEGLGQVSTDITPHVTEYIETSSGWIIRPLSYHFQRNSSGSTETHTIQLRWDHDNFVSTDLTRLYSVKTPNSNGDCTLNNAELSIRLSKNLTEHIEVCQINEDPVKSDFKVEANGISNIVKTSTNGLVDTYTITLDDGTTKTFTVTNGVGITSIAKVDVGEYEDHYEIRLTNGGGMGFSIPNANAMGIKTPMSGTVIHAEDALPINHLIETKVEGVNLIPYPFSDTTKTVNGITFTDNGDGSITANGTATDNAVFYFTNVETRLYIDGDVYLSGCPSGGSMSTGGYSIRLNYYVDGRETSGIVDSGAGKQGKFDNVLSRIYFVVMSGGTVDNLVVKPMLNRGTEKKTYVPGVNLTGAKLTVCGKNMFDSSKLLKTYTSDPSKTWTQHVEFYSGLPGVLDHLYGMASGNPIVDRFEPNTQYTLSLTARADITDAAPNALTIIFKYSDDTYTALDINTAVYARYSITSTAGKTVAGLYMSYGHNVRTYLKNIQLEKGTTATSEFMDYNEVSYGVDSYGELPIRVTSSGLPNLTIFVNRPNVVINAAYRMDPTAAYDKLNAKIEALLNGG